MAECPVEGAATARIHAIERDVLNRSVAIYSYAFGEAFFFTNVSVLERSITMATISMTIA